MKLATLKTSSRDGQLIVVSCNLEVATKVPDIANTLQQALDNWDKCERALATVYNELNEGKIKEHFPFEAKKVSSPLPRAYQWLDASAYVNHVQLVRKSRGVEMPASFWTSPLMYQGASDSFIGPCDPILIEDLDWGIDFEAEVAVITKEVPMGVPEIEAGNYIALIMLVNDVSLRNLAKPELDKGFGFLQCKPASAFSPVTVSPNELHDAWQGNKVHLPLVSHYNGKLFGQPNAGVDMTFGFAKLISHAAKTRTLCAGTILGSGTVSNTDRSKGSSCIVEKRMLETLELGKASTEFMQFGDTVRIEMFDKKGVSIFGAIEQNVVKYVKAV